jgi:hypothetical protein
LPGFLPAQLPLLAAAAAADIKGISDHHQVKI